MGIFDNERDGFKIYVIKTYATTEFESLASPEGLDRIAKNHLKELSGLLYITQTRDGNHYKIYFYTPLNYYLYNTEYLQKDLEEQGIKYYSIENYMLDYISNDGSSKSKMIKKIEKDIKNYYKEKIIYKARENINWLKSFQWCAF